MKLKETHNYDDIILLSRPVSQRHAPMARCDRAAQFSPFAALTGFEEAIEETGRLTDCRMELDEGEKQLLDEQMRKVLDKIHMQPEVKLIWFSYDERKAGGSYVSTTGKIKKIDAYNQKIILIDGKMIPLGEVFSVALTE